MWTQAHPSRSSRKRVPLWRAKSLAALYLTGVIIPCLPDVVSASLLRLILQAVFLEAMPRYMDSTSRGRNISIFGGTRSCSSTAKSRLLVRGGAATRFQGAATSFQFLSASFSVAQIICADFRFAKSARRITTANHSAATQWPERRWNLRFRSSRRRAVQSFMTPVSSIAIHGPLGSIISHRISALGFDLICQLVRCVLIMDTRSNATDTTAAGTSTSMLVINFERI